MIFQGSAGQDTRFSDKEKKLLKQMKFGDSLTQKVSYFFSNTKRMYFFVQMINNMCSFLG